MFQGKAADITTSSTVVLYFGSLNFVGVLQVLSLLVALVCGAFSIYFHIKRFRRERKK